MPKKRPGWPSFQAWSSAWRCLASTSLAILCAMRWILNSGTAAEQSPSFILTEVVRRQREFWKTGLGIRAMEEEGDAKLEDRCVTAGCRDASGAVGGASGPGGGETPAWWDIAGGPCRRPTQSGHAPGTDLPGDHSFLHGVQLAGRVRPAWVSEHHR